MDRRAPRARPRAPRLLWLRNRLPVLRRSGPRPRPRRPRSRRRSHLPPMNDLRARIAAIVERDRARDARGADGAELAVPTETLATRRDPSGAAAGFPSRGGPRSAPLAATPPFEVREQRIAA